MVEVTPADKALPWRDFKNEENLLHEAARRGDLDKVRHLVKSGCLVNHGNFDSVTPLHEACLGGHDDCVLYLLQSGADVNARNVDGATPLCDASNSGSLSCVQMLLEYGANVNPPLCFTSPLHEAVLRDHIEVTAVLLQARAYLEATDLHFGTPLHVAAYKGHVASAELLLRAGARVNAAKTHQTALHMASSADNRALCKLLLEFGANVYVENPWGKRPRDLLLHPSSPLHELLLLYESYPMTLLQLCRLSIRRAMAPCYLHKMDTLPLPAFLIKFLYYQ